MESNPTPTPRYPVFATHSSDCVGGFSASGFSTNGQGTETHRDISYLLCRYDDWHSSNGIYKASFLVSTVDTEHTNDQMADVPKQKFVLLLRVSTNSQGAEGHGIAAQRRDIQLFLNSLQETFEVVEEFVEVESGAKESRPVLEDALNACRKHQGSLLVQKVDRITRDLEVLARIVKDPTVRLRVASLPNADNFQIHLFGCLATQEREFISTRTKAALAAAKAKGIRLGNPRLAEMNRTRKRAARHFADQHSNLIWSLRNKGKTLREICAVLNDAGITTAKGGVFHPVQVTRILRRSPNPALATS